MAGLPRLVMGLMLDRRVPLRLKLLLPAAIVYLVSPIDLIPDLMLPVLGRVDDVLVIVFALAVFLAMAPRDVVLEHVRRRRTGQTEDGSGDDSRGPQTPVIEGTYRIEDDERERGR